MTNKKQHLGSYYRYYIGFIICLWIATFFISWDTQLGGVLIYFFLMKYVFPVLGIMLIILSIALKKIKGVLLGICVMFAFFINMFILFAILPRFFGN